RLAIALESLFVTDEHGNLRGVLAGIENLLGRVVVGIETQLWRAIDGALAAGDVVAVDGRRRGERSIAIKRLAILALALETGHRAQAGKRHFAQEFSGQVEHLDLS